MTIFKQGAIVVDQEEWIQRLSFAYSGSLGVLQYFHKYLGQDRFD